MIRCRQLSSSITEAKRTRSFSALILAAGVRTFRIFEHTNDKSTTIAGAGFFFAPLLDKPGSPATSTESPKFARVFKNAGKGFDWSVDLVMLEELSSLSS